MIENRMANDKCWPLGEQQVSDSEAVEIAVSAIQSWAVNNGDGATPSANLHTEAVYTEILEGIDQGDLFGILYQSAFEGHIWTGCEIGYLIEGYTKHYCKKNVSKMRKIFSAEIADYIAERE